MLFQPAGKGAHEVLAPYFAFPIMGLSAGGAGGADVVDGVLEYDFWHCGRGREGGG